MTQTRQTTDTHGKRSVTIETDGDRQIIRLPVDIHFDGDLVDLRRDDVTGDVILSQRPKARTWDELFAMIDAAGPLPDDFMADRPMNGPTDPHGVFDDEIS